MAVTDPSQPSAQATTRGDAAVGAVHSDLRRGSIGLAGVLMQSVAQISPTLGIFYTIAFNTGQAGQAAPLTYLAAFVICLVIAVPMTAWPATCRRPAGSTPTSPRASAHAGGS